MCCLLLYNRSVIHFVQYSTKYRQFCFHNSVKYTFQFANKFKYFFPLKYPISKAYFLFLRSVRSTTSSPSPANFASAPEPTLTTCSMTSRTSCPPRLCSLWTTHLMDWRPSRIQSCRGGRNSGRRLSGRIGGDTSDCIFSLHIGVFFCLG